METVSSLSFGIHARASCSSLATSIPVLFWKAWLFSYSHRLLFVIGLVISRTLTNSAIISVLSSLISPNGDDIVKSAILTNIHDVLSSFFMVFMAYAADSFIRRFKTLLFSNFAYIVALVLFWKFHPHDEIWILVVTLVLLALGTSGKYILQDALGYLVNDIDKSPDPDETRSSIRATIWYRAAYVLGSVLAILLWVFCPFDSSWKSAFFICIISITLAVIISGFGPKVYQQEELITERHVSTLWCLKIFSRQDRSADKENVENEGNVGIRPCTGNSSYKQEDKVILKSLLKMIPMWVVFTMPPLISATGSTFYLQQYSNLNTENSMAVQFYTLVQDCSKFAIPFIYGSCLPKNEKIKIGLGMVCGVVSCTCAWQLEVYRLKEVSHLVDQEMKTHTSISFLWLVPQFCLLGCMQGLTEEGLFKFNYSQMKEQQHSSHVEKYIALVKGTGQLLNILLILIFKGWFGDTINRSRLDKYYLVLVILSSVNFITYCCIARLFYKVQELPSGDDQDFKNDDLPEDHLMEVVSDMTQNQLDLAEDDHEQAEPAQLIGGRVANIQTEAHSI